MTVRSPFARRIRLALRRHGVRHKEVPTDVFNPSAEFLRKQPLGMVPGLELPNGEWLPDSQVILEYLEQEKGGVLPRSSKLKTLSVYAVGIMTATVAWYLESQRPSPYEEFQQEQKDIIIRALSRLAESTSELGDSLAFWDVAVALEYLNFRMPDLQWVQQWPTLVTVLERARQGKDFAETQPRLQ